MKKELNQSVTQTDDYREVNMNIYQAPTITIHEFKLEKGFAASTGGSNGEDLGNGNW